MMRVMLGCCFPLCLFGQPSGTSFPFSALAYSRNPELVAVFASPAVAARWERTTLAVAAQRPYGVGEIGRYEAAGVLPAGAGSFSLVARLANAGSLQRSALGGGYGRRMGALTAGVRICYMQHRVSGYGTAGSVGVEGAGLLQLSSELVVGMGMFHASPLGQAKERPPASVHVGWGWTISGQAFLGMELKKEEGRRSEAAFVLQYAPHPRIALRLGLNTTTMELELGSRVLPGDWPIDLGFSFHPRLGATPALLLGYQQPER